MPFADELVPDGLYVRNVSAYAQLLQRMREGLSYEDAAVGSKVPAGVG